MREHVRAGRPGAAVRLLTVLTVVVGLGRSAGASAGLTAGAGHGLWVWPVAGAPVVVRPFEPASSRYGPRHLGADLLAAAGTAIRAAGAGRVSSAGLLAGRGVVVVVHGDLRTVYEPVVATVRTGQLVQAGAVLGRLTAGHVGCPGTCLHWALLRGDSYLDPVQLVARAPSRLLPVDSPTGSVGLQALAVRPPVARPAATAAAPSRAAEPALVLRAADVGWGLTALIALVVALVLLLRPRRPPAGPAAPTYTVTPPEATGLVDLAAERARRRTEVA